MHLDEQDFEAARERRALDEATAKRGEFYAVDDMNETLNVSLAVPAGKSLEQPTLDILAKLHIDVHRKHPRSTTAEISNLPGVSRLVFLKGDQIVRYVADGTIPLGITAEDNVFESELDVHICTSLSFGRAAASGGKTRGVFFTGKENPVDSIFEIERDDVIISEYPRQTEAFFKKFLTEAVVEKCTGSAEALVAMGRYKYGVVLTETGTSLRVNGLKEIETLFESRTVLIVNKQRYTKDSHMHMCADNLARCLNSILQAQNKCYLIMNVPSSSVSAILHLLPSLESPTVQPLANEKFVSIASVVPQEHLNFLKLQLWQLGARGIVELDASSVM